MNDLLTRVRADVPAPTDEALSASRARLMRATVAPARRGRALPLAAGATAAAAVVAVVVVAPWQTGPASAADLLHSAADATNDPVVGPGQYLVVRTEEDALGYVSADDGTGILGAYRSRRVTTTYVPEERSGVWTARSWSLPSTTTYGGPRVAAAAARDYAVDAHADDPSVERARGGAFGNGELGGDGPTGPLDPSTLPRDPGELLDRLAQQPLAGASRSERAFDAARQLLTSGLAQRDLRAAIYDALAMLPDIVVVDRQSDLDGREGAAIGLRGGGYEDTVVIDTDAGDFLGTRTLQTKTVGAVPAGTVADLTSVRVGVADQVPEG